MAIYIIDVFITGFLSMFAIKELDEQGIETYQSKRKRIILLLMILLLWVLLFTFHGTTGSDSAVYRFNYKQAYYQHISLGEMLDKNRDKLLQIIMYLGIKVFNGSWIAFCFMAALVLYIPIIILINKKSEDINTSCLIFLLSLSALYGYNGLKQAIACSFIMCAYYFGLREKKYFRYIILMLVGYGFHAATLLVIPFHLISLKKLKSISTRIILIGLFVLTFFLSRIWSNVLAFFGEDDLVSKYTEMFTNAHGSGILRVLVWVAPVVICFFIYPTLKSKYSDVDHDILMVLFGTVFMIYSMLNANFSQMAFFFSVSNIILYPKILNSFEPQNKKTLKYFIIILYFVYFTVLLWNGESMLSPYISVWKSKTF